jgi:Tol biopolymer transport system component
MTLASGTRLNIYEILAPIGAGGMGEVYRARDTKLGREVAIKVLPEAFSRDKERMARFEREAKLLASLNHANIATLYGLEESDGQLYLAMELVEGETLAERIARGPIPMDEAILLFVQIAEGLEVAHDKGVVHRDLKPANIKITPEGKIKILDFGLAKAFLPEENVSEESARTLTKGTQLGAIIGTPSYMSPEQARGKSVDRRSDIWAFGCCLHEALTGKKTFEGETVTDVLAAVVQREPDWNKLPRETPVSLRRALSRSLQKDPGLRFHHIADARIELIDGSFEEPLTVTGSHLKWPLFAYVLAAVVAIAAILLGWTTLFSPSPPPAVVRLDVNLPDGQELPDAYTPVFAMSPDGRQLVYSTGTSDRTQFFLRALDDFDVRRIAVEIERMPVFSPNGQWFGFYAGDRLRKVSVSGGAPLLIAQAPRLLSGASWSPDDSIVIASPSGLRRVSADGGVFEKVVGLQPGAEAGSPAWPYFLPDGRGLIFTVLTASGPRPAVFSFQTGEGHFLALIGEGGGARYVASGHVVDAHAGHLLAAPFDLDTLQLGGIPQTVVDGVYTSLTTGLAYFDISDAGTLAYVPKGETNTGNALVLVDRAGSVTRILEKGSHYLNPHFSPSGRRVAVSERTEPNRPDIWILDLESGTRTRLTSTRDVEQAVWTPDGERITFIAARQGSTSIYWKRVDGSGEEEPLLNRSDHAQIGSWTADGKRLAFMALNPDTGLGDLWVLSEESEASPVAVTPFDEQEPSFSPDGRFIAFASDESGRDEIYVQLYGISGGKRPISKNGGREPVWSRDGSEIFYRQNGALMVVAVESGEELAFEQPQILFEDRFLSPFMNPSVGETTYDVSPDGRSFVMIQRSAEAKRNKIHVVLNWFEELSRLVPTDK